MAYLGRGSVRCEYVCWGGGCPSLGGPACPPAHPAKNTAGLKPDPPPSGLLKAAGSLTPGSLPTLMPWAQPLPPPGQDAKEAPRSQGGRARESQSWAQSPGLHFTPCPWSTSRPHRSCQGDTGPCLAFGGQPASGISPTPRAYHFLSVDLYLSSMRPRASVFWVS